MYQSGEMTIDWIPTSSNISVCQLKINIKQKSLSDEMYVDFLKNFVGIIRLITQKFTIIFDTTNLNVNENDVKRLLGNIKLFAEVNKELFECYNKYLVCTCIIVSSPSIKNLINLVLQNFYTPHRPIKIFQLNSNYREFIEKSKIMSK